MTINYYQVGGCVRDAILGVKSKDIDYAVEASSFEEMVADIKARGGEVFLEKPEYLTARAKLGKEIADFVLCRKESYYSDGRRPDSVSLGDIYDDLSRRDFTMNAIARKADGTLIDPYSGETAIGARIIECVGDPRERFTEDSLRLLRAFRFMVTKGFTLIASVERCMLDASLVSLLSNVSKERIREEMLKCFKFNTWLTLDKLDHFKMLQAQIFADGHLWLMPTLEQK